MTFVYYQINGLTSKFLTPNGQLIYPFLIKQRAGHGLTHLLVNSSPDDAISETAIDNLDIVLSDDLWIRDAVDGRVRLKYILDQLDHRYDFVFIDTQGTVGPLRGLIYRQDRTVDARLIANELRPAAFIPSKGAITILDTVIPNAVVYREAATAKLPVHRLETARNGPTLSAHHAMLALAEELIPNLPNLSQLEHIA